MSRFVLQSPKGLEIVIYEPSHKDEKFDNSKILKNLCELKRKYNIIIANRSHADLSDVQDRAFTRDIYGKD